MVVDEGDVKELLRRLGVNATYKGYYYVSAAVMLAVEDEQVLEFMSKKVYSGVAEIYHTSVSCVERDIRMVKRRMLESGNDKLLQNIFGYVPAGRIENGYMISMLADYLMKMKADDWEYGFQRFSGMTCLIG